MTGKRKKKTESGPELGFEEALGKLEAIVKELEGGDVPLEKALSMFEEGVRLSNRCHQKLSEAEKKVQILLRNEAGELEAKPFETDEEDDVAGEEGEEDEGDEEDNSLF